MKVEQRLLFGREGVTHSIDFFLFVYGINMIIFPVGGGKGSVVKPIRPALFLSFLRETNGRRREKTLSEGDVDNWSLEIETQQGISQVQKTKVQCVFLGETEVSGLRNFPIPFSRQQNPLRPCLVFLPP